MQALSALKWNPRKAKARRVLSALTQEESAHQMSVRPNTISRWESGTSVPSINSVCMMAAIYDCNITDFLDYDRQELETSG